MMLPAVDPETYRIQGYLTGVPILGPSEAEEVTRRFDELEAEVGREAAAIGLVDRHFDRPFIWNLATHPRILESVGSIIGPNFFLLASHFFCKYGPADRFVAWHQDATYWALDPPNALTVWYAVDDSDTENGCMRVIPGTHRTGLRSHGKSGQPGNLLSINQEVPVTPEEESRAVDLVLRAGEASFHDGALIHGSLPNLSVRRRCGLTLRYIPTSVKPTGQNSMGKTWNAILVSGQDVFHHFGRADPPF